MKDNFPGYYHDPDFKKLFNECIFVFDASVLLALYELPKEDTKICLMPGKTRSYLIDYGFLTKLP